MISVRSPGSAPWAQDRTKATVSCPGRPPRLESEWHELTSGRRVALALVIHGVGSGEAVLVRPGPLTRLRAAVCAGDRGVKENSTPSDVVAGRNIKHSFFKYSCAGVRPVPSCHTLLFDSCETGDATVVAGGEIPYTVVPGCTGRSRWAL